MQGSYITGIRLTAHPTRISFTPYSRLSRAPSRFSSSSKSATIRRLFLSIASIGIPPSPLAQSSSLLPQLPVTSLSHFRTSRRISGVLGKHLAFLCIAEAPAAISYKEVRNDLPNLPSRTLSQAAVSANLLTC